MITRAGIWPLFVCIALGVPMQSKAEDPGEKVFRAHCDACHARGQAGANLLARRIGWEDALLEKRKGLIPDYIRHVVRNGRNNMPPLTRVELTDDELNRIIAFLTKEKDSS